MRKGVFGRKFKRTKNERRRLFQGLVKALLLRDGIRTTLARAKAIVPLVEKMVTRAKQADQQALDILNKELADYALVKKFVNQAKARFAGRKSGYTKIFRLGKRRGDAAESVFLTFSDTPVVEKPPAKVNKTTEAVVKKKTSKTKK